jgi:hypothetical protein
MLALIIFLILISFVEASIWSINLLLMIILLRAYIRVGVENLYLAFGFGLLLSFLEHTPMGLYSLLFIALVTLIHMISKAPLSKNLFTVVPSILITLVIGDYVLSIIRHVSWQMWPQVLYEAILILPIYIVLKLWEERFVVKKGVKLKV